MGTGLRGQWKLGLGPMWELGLGASLKTKLDDQCENWAWELDKARLEVAI